MKAATRHAGASKALDLGTELQVLTGTPSGVALLRHGVLGSAEPGETTELFAGAPEPPARRPAPASGADDREGEPGRVPKGRARSGATATPGRRGRATGSTDDGANATNATSEATEVEGAIDTSAATRRASAQAIKRHEAAVAKTTRAREIAAREVARLTGELEQATAKLAQLEAALAELEASAPS